MAQRSRRAGVATALRPDQQHMVCQPNQIERTRGVAHRRLFERARDSARRLETQALTAR